MEPGEEGKQLIMQMTNNVCNVFNDVAAQLMARGIPAEMVIHAALCTAATQGAQIGCCPDAMHTYLGDYLSRLEVAKLKCPHCGPEAAARRS